MTGAAVTDSPRDSLRSAATRMWRQQTGSLIVVDDAQLLGIITERDILNAVGNGLDPDVEKAASHITWDVVYAGPNWTLEEAAAAMVRGGFRHLVVLEGDEVLGIISVRDILRVWSTSPARTTA